MKKILIVALIAFFCMVSTGFARDATVSWTMPDDDRVTGVLVYHGPNNPPTVDNGGTQIDAGMATEQEITGLTVGDTVYFGAKSYDADGNTSVFSNILEWVVPPDIQTIPIPSVDRPKEIRLIFE